jgi:hypothetical protein
MHDSCDDSSDRRGVCFFSGRTTDMSANIVIFEGNSGISCTSFLPLAGHGTLETSVYHGLVRSCKPKY